MPCCTAQYGFSTVQYGWERKWQWERHAVLDCWQRQRPHPHLGAMMDIFLSLIFQYSTSASCMITSSQHEAVAPAPIE